MPWYVFLVPVASTLLGGGLAIRWRARLDLLLAIGTGLLLGAALFDLLPEALVIGRPSGYGMRSVLALTLASYVLFLAIDKAVDALTRRSQKHSGIFIGGEIGASLLIFHSFRDGMAIGVAYTSSHHSGYIVALAIAAHDIGDGMNTILLTTRGAKPRRADYAFLLADAAAPFAGGLLVRYLNVSPLLSVILLALSTGFFLQLILGDLLPQLRASTTPRARLVACTLAGFAILLLINLALHHPPS